MIDISPESVCFDVHKIRGTEGMIEIVAQSSEGLELADATLFRSGSALELMQVDVIPEYRGNKIGSAVIEKAIEVGANDPSVNIINTSAYNERTLHPFCRIFDADKLDFCIRRKNYDGFDVPIDAKPEEVIKMLVDHRKRQMAQKPNERPDARLSGLGIGIRAHLL